MIIVFRCLARLQSRQFSKIRDHSHAQLLDAPLVVY